MDIGPTLVLGASLNDDRYSNRAIRSLRAHGHHVVAVGLREGAVGDTVVVKDVPKGVTFHTITLYMNARNQEQWMPRILALSPKRIIFNPGAENPALAAAAGAQGIETLEACTLVMLSTGQY